jgi:hypothetical protein
VASESLPTFSLNRKFLDGQGDVSLAVSAPDTSKLLAALQTTTNPIPAGDLVLGDIKAQAGGEGTVGFGGGTKGSVTFSGQGEASFGLGVYADAAEAIKAASPASELADGLILAHPAATRFIVLRASYNIAAAAKGSVALGMGASVTFGVSGSSAGAFTVLHRFGDSEPAVQVFKDLFTSWGLPRQIADAKDLAVGTWLMAEVDGSIAMQVGIQAGYDFSWIREIPGGALQGDIGLRVQLGASAALGFEASGKYALVLGRESAAEVLRLRLYKMARKGWTFAFDARVGFKAELPPFFDQPHKAEDLVAAIFGLNQNQIIEVLRETRGFVNSNVSLQDKLAGVLMELGGTAIEKTAGLSEQQIRDTYEAGRKRVVDFLAKFDTLLKNGGHELASMLLSLAPADITSLTTVLQDIAGSGSAEGVQELVRGLVSKAGFERSVGGRFIEAAVGPALAVITNTEVGNTLKSVAGVALPLLNGDTLQNLLDFLRREIRLDKIQTIANETDFDHLDNLLKARLAAFLGKQKVLMADLNQIQDAVRSVLNHVDKFYEMALKAAKQEQEFAFSAGYARSTTSTALVDINFDTSKDLATRDLLRRAIDGDLNDILLTEKPGVSINVAELTHNIARNVSSELTMPFGAISQSSSLLSSAKLTVQEDHGRVLVYTLDTSSTESERRSLFGAHSGRDSTLTIAATMPLAVGNGVKIWKDNTFSYSYRMERAVLKMRASQLQEEIGPLITRYVPSAFATPAARSFPEWVADLDKVLDNKDSNSGTHDIGDTLIALSLSAPPSNLRAWTQAPQDRSDPVYMRLSLALQARLKELVTFYYFSDPARYKDLAAAAAPVVYSCIPVSTSIRLNGDGEVERFNTNRDIYWDQADSRQIEAMVGARQTAIALTKRLATISATLRDIPDLAHTAAFYAPDPPQIGSIIAASLKRFSFSATIPELLGSLLFLEKRIVENAVDTGIEMARFQKDASQKPAEALAHLARFGEELAATFNETLGRHPFLSGASRPLATLLFMEAASIFDATVTGNISAMMNITVIRSGKLSVDDMLAGQIATTPDMILYEQPFVEA